MPTCSPWATVADVCSPCDDYAFDEILLEDSLQLASDVLYNFTGRQWAGVCDDVVRPCGNRTTMVWGRYAVPVGTLATAALPLVGWCGCYDSRTCGCRRLSEIRLPGFPVVAITEVKIDGQVVDPARYRLDDNRWLVWIPDPTDVEPRKAWPCCQRTDLPDTEVGTFSIAYTFGSDPPIGGVRAAASLGCQLALSCQPETVGACRLPKRVTTITRQGISLAVLDPLTLFKDGLTGLSEVDLWVQSVFLGAKRRRATVKVIGSGRRFRRVGT